jgi:hypothetical protein
MSKSFNLRGGEKIAAGLSENRDEEDVVIEIVEEVAEVDAPAPKPATPAPEANITINSLDSICENVGETLRAEIVNVVDNLKSYLAAELTKYDKRILLLVSEIVDLKDALSESYVKINSLESKFDEHVNLCGSSNAAPALNSLPPKQSIDMVVAGDSIVKHIKIDQLEGKNELICLPGAHCHKVHLAVCDLAKKAQIKKLVLHFGTNHIPRQSPLQIVNEITDTLKRVQLELPNTKTFFSAVLPKIDSSYNRGINFINQRIHDFCHENNMGFIQHSAFSRQGEFNKNLFAPTEWRLGRPIHPSHDGAMSLLKDIKLSTMVQLP